MDTNRIVKLCTTENMSFTELYEDPLFNKIPKKNLRNYINDLDKIAKEKATKVKNENENLNLMDICKSQGVKVNVVNNDDSGMNINYRAEIYYEKKVINITKNSITQMYNQLQKFNYCEDKYSISVDKIKDIHVAHELYHLFEYIDNEETGNLLPKITNIKIGKFERKSKIIKTSEAAAHIFCMEILDLPFHPKLLDYLYLVGTGKVTEEKLLEFLEYIQKCNEII